MKLLCVTCITILLSSCSSDEVTNPNGGISYSQIDFDASWSRAGDRIAYSHNDLEPEFSGLYVMDSSGANVVQLEEGNISNPDWSPLDTALIYDVGGSLIIRNMANGNKRIVSNQSNARTAKWNPANPLIAFIADKFLILINPEGTWEKYVDAGCDWPAWTPDGRYLYFFKPSYNISGQRTGDTLKVLDLQDTIVRLVNRLTSETYLTNSHLSVTESDAYYSSTFGDGKSYVYLYDFQTFFISQLISQLSYSPDVEHASNKLVFTNRTPSDGRLWIREKNGSMRRIDY